MSQLDILHVGTLPPHRGGSAVSNRQLLEGFAARGHRVRSFSPITDEWLQQGDDYSQRHPEIGVQRYVVPYFHYHAQDPAPDSYRNVEDRRFREQLPEILADRPDIAFIGREYMAMEAMPILKAHSLPVVIRAAGGTTFGLAHGKYPPVMAERLIGALGQADRIVAVAAYQAGWLRSLGLTRVQVILNAVDVRLFSPAPRDSAFQRLLGIRDSHLVVLFSGNLNYRKRPLDLAKAASIVLAQRDDVIFVVLGTGPLQNELDATCRRLGIFEQFRMIGWLDYDQVPPYFNLADLVVLPSEGEGLARVYLEAQASGRVLIASDIEAAREVVEHGETGLLFRTGDAEDLAAKILLVAGDPELRRKIGQQARHRMAAHDLERALDTFLATFETVIREHHD